MTNTTYRFYISLYDTKSDGWNNNYISVYNAKNEVVFNKITLQPDNIIDEINKFIVTFELSEPIFYIKYFSHEGFYPHENYYAVYYNDECVYHSPVGEAPNKTQKIDVSHILTDETTNNATNEQVVKPEDSIDTQPKETQKSCNKAQCCKTKNNTEISTKYDVLLVGCGLFSATFAQQCIEHNQKVLIVEKRNHIAGNCYTRKVDTIDVHEYGPHIFHTNNDDIWNYVNRFATFNNFINKPKILHNDNIYSFPINLMTLYKMWGVKTPEEARQKLESVKIHNENPQNLEEWILSQVGEEIYHTFIYGYTKKQWNTEPKDLPSFIIKRLPIRLNYDDNYYFDKYQGIPTNGYTEMVQNMLGDSHVILNTDYFANKSFFDSLAKTTVYTGPIDKYFEYEYGKLNYRSLRFEHKVLPMEDFQGNAIINYTNYDIPHTRIIEHKHFNHHQTDITAISKEYPQDFDGSNEPYYPINNSENNAIADKYRQLSKNSKNIIFGGRLAEYKYYDMHQVIGSALKKFKTYNNDRS